MLFSERIKIFNIKAHVCDNFINLIWTYLDNLICFIMDKEKSSTDDLMVKEKNLSVYHPNPVQYDLMGKRIATKNFDDEAVFSDEIIKSTSKDGDRVKESDDKDDNVGKASHRPRGDWINTNIKYTMSEELYDYICCRVLRDKFKYRMGSISKEISHLFPGCVINVQDYYEAKKHRYWRIPAYCTHLNCRNYKLLANFSDPRVFEVYVDNQEILHVKPLARQVQKYERDVMMDDLENELANTYLSKLVNKTPKALIEAGSLGDIISEDVVQKCRSKALQRQDTETDDFADLEALQTKDENTNFVSKILHRHNFGTYIHSKNQMKAFNKLHKKRDVDGVPIIGRMDASGEIARPLNPGDKLLYYALTTNVTVLTDKHSTALPLSEQYNIRQTSKDIASWLFDFTASYFEIFDNPPLLFDYMISDFSYANFHAIQLAFNRLTLPQYLKKCYDWIQHKIDIGEFPEAFSLYTKIKMCFTHIMHTYGGMTKRHYGTTESKAQLRESRLILEILGSMVKATSFVEVIQLFEQMTILLSREYKSDAIDDAILAISAIVTPIEEDLDLDSENNLNIPVDLDALPENCPTMYKCNPFYLQFKEIADRQAENVVEEGAEKNPYFNPGFLDKFLKRFVPLIPLWTSILNVEVKESPGSQLNMLQVQHNQPLETYFGKFKMNLWQKAVEIGKAPVKIARAIKLSQELINSSIKRIDSVIPKNALNSQLPRKPYTKRKPVDEIHPVQSSSNVHPKSSDFHLDDVANIDDVAGNVADTVDVADAGTTFKTATEQYNKKHRSNFSYFQKKNITKAAAKTTKPTLKASQIYRSNGLFKDAKFYCNLNSDFIVSMKNDSKLNNKTFEILSDERAISRELMTYALQLVPVKFQVEFYEHNSIFDSLSTLKFNKKIIFLVSLQNDRYILIVINTINKMFAALDPTTNQSTINFFETFGKIHKNWNEVHYEIDSVENYNSGIYVFNYIFQYILMSTITKAMSTPLQLRLDLQKKIVAESINMKDLCLHCGTEDAGIWGQCTFCERWFHCNCVKVDPKLIKNQQIYHCVVCKVVCVASNT